MMGPRQVDQAALFYEFSLERHVPAFASRLVALLSMTVHWTGQACVEGEIHFPAVVQTVGFGLGRPKMPYPSTGVE
jgi:hypothetical protein